MAISRLHTFVIRTRVARFTLCGLAALPLFCAQARAEDVQEPGAVQTPRESQEPQVPQEPLFSLHPVDGRLVLEPHAAGHINCGGGRYFTSVKDEAQFDNY